ncbi:MAG TPA: site-2 protease family protein [Mycobacteriales bacterium]|nr:site-2 protease family protein [Mycobacteriales bacterium]
MSTDGLPLPVPARPPGRWAKVKQAAAPLTGFVALVAKLKSALFLGSMAVSIAAYAQLWGWRYAVGFVALILVHELGHVVALRVRGIRASGLVFIPLLGAFTSWQPTEHRPYQEAETALAGPVIGTVGALALALYGHEQGSSLLRALAFTGLLLNLLNLIPLVPLDGGRVADLLYPWVWVVVGLGLVGYLVVRFEPLVLIILLLVGYELYSQRRQRGRAAAVQPRLRLRLSIAYLVLLAVIGVGLHATYLPRHLS